MVKGLLVDRRCRSQPFSQESSLSLSPCSECLSCQQVRVLEVLLPHLAGAVVEDAQVTGAGLCIWARAQADTAACPRCGRPSARVHSRYQRRLTDVAIGGRKGGIRLGGRRFFCDAPDCPAATFAGQVEGLTSRDARRPPLLAAMRGGGAVGPGWGAGGVGRRADQRCCAWSWRSQTRPGPLRGCSGWTTSRSNVAKITAPC